MKTCAASFARLVAQAMARRGLGLRELCRRAELDPSFFSKVLAGKRNPPSEEEPLRRLAAALELDPIELIVTAGRIPRDWSALWGDPALLRAVHRLAAAKPIVARQGTPALPAAASRRGLSEELL